MQKIQERYYKTIDDHFKKIFSVNKKYTIAVFYSGKIVYKMLHKSSDIDVVFVFKNLSPDKLERVVESIKKDYFEIHMQLNLKADKLWPGEYITACILNEALEGRGFDLKNGILHLSPIKSDLECTINRLYRYWWSMLLFSKFLCGDKRAYEKYKEKAWRLAVSFILYNFTKRYDKRLYTIEDFYDFISEGGKEFLGITRKYKNNITYRNQTITSIRRALFNLQKEGMVKFENDSVRLIELRILTRRMKVIEKRVKTNKWRTSPIKGYTYFFASKKG